MYKKKLTMGIFAHANAGKTTITEHMLYHMKVIDKVGRVDMGNTVSDSMKVEKQRGISVKNSLISFDLEDIKIQLLDTPGHVDFSAEVERAISVLDGAVLVLSGVEGVEAQTHVIWEALKKKSIPVIIFINKLDRRGAHYTKVVEELRVKLQIPIMAMHEITVRDEMILRKESAILEMAEQASEADEKLLEYIINNKEIDKDYLYENIVTLVHSAKVYPVIGGSALKDDGLDILLKCIGKFFKPYVNKDEEKLSAYVYSVKSDYSTKDVYVKILQGTLEVRSMITTDGETHQKVKELLVPQGEKLVQVNKVYSGEIAIIRGLDVACNQYIGEVQEENDKLQFVNPQLIMEIKAKNDCETIELMKVLKILTEEDPYLDVTLDTSINSICIKLIGEIQAQIIESFLMERFNIPICISNPMVLYKEAPTRIGKAKVSYTSVSAIELQVRPLEKGSGFVYNSKISTDYLHIKYQRQVEKLIRNYAKQGLMGWELTDIEVSLIGGQFDSMGSDPKHFNIITPIAFFRCLKQSKIKLLEPICYFTVTFPELYINDVTQSLIVKKSIFQIVKNQDGTCYIEGHGSVDNMLNYSIELYGLTSGRGTYVSRPSHYETSICQNKERKYIGPDPRNEVKFVINDMKASIEALDRGVMKKKKQSRSKFKRFQQEKRQKDEKLPK